MFSLPYMRVLVPVLTGVIIIAVISYTRLTLALASNAASQGQTMTFQGEGKMTVTPDIVSFSFTVSADGDGQTTAQTASAEKINAIMDYLKENDIEEKDITTENYNLSPKYEDIPIAIQCIKAPCVQAYPPDTKRIQVGYTVSQSVTVKVRKMDGAGKLLAGIGEKGATNLSDLTFSVDDMDTLNDNLREIAIKDAKEKAEKRAEQLGVKLGKITNFYENNGPYPMLLRANSAAFGGGFDKAEPVAPTLSAGENTYTVNVSISYTLK